MPKAIAANYETAQRLIASGAWVVDVPAGAIRRPSGKPLRRRNSSGYIYLSLPGSRASVMAHRVIWEYVYGPVCPDLEINHLNGIKTDNRLSNLEVVTPCENMRHARRTGLNDQRGTASGQAKLTETQVLEIFTGLRGGDSPTRLAATYGVSRGTVRAIGSGHNWSHLTGLPSARKASI